MATTVKKCRTGWILLIVLVPAGLRAELLTFNRGGRVQLPAEANRDGTIRLDLPDGPITFSQGDFRKVVPGHWPEHDWPRRSEAARRDGAHARFAAAWWALENGLTPEAEAMTREACLADPGQPASARLKATLDRLDDAQGCPLPDLAPLRSALGGPFEVASGPHVVLLHQHGTVEAGARLEVLERVVRSFYLMFAGQGLELPLPRRRLVVAWFVEQSDYLAFLHAEGADAFRTTMGYYHPTLNAVMTYDLRSSPAQRSARDALAQVPRERPHRDAQRRLLLLELERLSFELGTAAHELVHLLVAESGLEPRHDDFPLWLHEGLAAQFEVVRGGRWAGFGRAHDLRLPDWRRIDPPPRLAPLLRDTGFGHGYAGDAYAAAWALVYYLRKERPGQFQTFLDLLRIPDAEVRPRADRTLALFRAAFGADLATLEADWHRKIDSLRAPLEEAP
jgi:hypothetical protein